MRKKIKRLKKILRILILLILLTIIIRAFFLGAFQIPTSSMANSLLPGDFIIVNLAAYKIKTPAYFPILGFPIPSLNLFSTGKPEINDVVLFSFPDVHNDPFYSTSIVKRIAAGPGDNLQIIDKRIYVNSKESELPESVLKSLNSIKPADEEDKVIYYTGSGWNNHNYGPIKIPAKGDTIQINPENIYIWKQLIVFEYEEKVVREEGSVITIEGKPVRDYIVKKDQYFVIGDNFSNSRDSRHFGFINEDMIIGKASFIYWSVNRIKSSGSIFSGIRWDRMFSGI
ncbi:MAG: signal peptidase I [Ignavibacterium sp.]|nr:MAG: signal peptidase I [Ignavibacterium sp.]